jgi:MFS family permease
MTDSPSRADVAGASERRRSWYYQLNRYQWFVLTVCTLGWVFDTMGQQLFNVARLRAVTGLLPDNPKVDLYAGIVTSIMLIGWATGGIIFGILGDKIGRARTMVMTILIYSIFTGISGFAQNYWDFILYRFLCGLGIGGQFSVGVALVAEYMPDHVRPRALAFLQAMANLGNVTAGLIGMSFSHLEKIDAISLGSSWRWTLAIGALPAFLAIPVFRSLKEPESWQKAVDKGAKRKKAGSLIELFGNPRWRKNTIIGMILASTGVIGLWGIGFFSIDLTQSVFRKTYEAEERQNGEAEMDRQFISLLAASQSPAGELLDKIQPKFLLSEKPSSSDAQQIFAAILALRKKGDEISKQSIIAFIENNNPLPAGETNQRHERLQAYLTPPAENSNFDISQHAKRIFDREQKLKGRTGAWAGWTSILFNIGGFCGAYAFSFITGWLGRRWAFAVSFILAGVSTSIAFLYMSSAVDVCWMTPLMGGCIFLIFGGYAVYFPELYPTRLRSTGTSFCYNIGRYVAALGPLTIGLLTSEVFKNYPEPMRYAGATMCAIFVVGLIALPFAPETKDQPLPE